MTKFKRWLIISHGFNMDGRAASLTVTDKIPYLQDQGVVNQVHQQKMLVY